MRTFTHITEFYVRPADPRDKDGVEAWHLTLSTLVDFEDGSPIIEIENKRKTLNMSQAAEQGYTLPAIMSELNLTNQKSYEALEVQKVELQGQLDLEREKMAAASDEIARLRKLITVADSLIAQASAKNTELLATVASMRDQVTGMTAEIQEKDRQLNALKTAEVVAE